MVNVAVQRAKGILCAIFMFLSSSLGAVLMMGPVLPFMLLKPDVCRRKMDELIGLWETLPVAVLEIVMGMKIRIYGDRFIPGERCIIVMNHRTRLDWMFFWSCLFRYEGGTRHEKISLKKALKHVPGTGWAMQNAAYIFLERKWETDKILLQKMIGYFADLKHKTQLLIFPEGTDLTANTKNKSDIFAQKNNKKSYDYVLHPKTTGFSFIAQEMRKNNALDAIYDVTVGYPDSIPQTEQALLHGNLPKEVHFYCKRHPVVTIPITEEGLGTWLQNQWEKKEECLKNFYEEKQFTGVEELKFHDNEIRYSLYFYLTFWVTATMTFVFLILFSHIARIYALAVGIFYFSVDKLFGGTGMLQIEIHRWLQKALWKTTKKES
ncbi:LOW QUALITY PROTEIN: lysocardiolipin acyltransferase 1-like [Lingula anatina]|uniref:LOW QUALITY PROTEIN: lysocardiolipin acyltransferase 1-like n=1 Tax=Lingula anatina TaxID=7574 RepID=A0A1S3I0E0_LINAN|nr:LOW QUALITY PROTEIN: lysocardiolipin acyltransferase 1-like [Lingula anatina]|eukprot:XP_013391730.1 LOW QUALITY PROTEIN: lysocardiolipin acyltransferase 1-like [Lingula anatina]